MMISFDGNVYVGKTTLIKSLSQRYGFSTIDEHSFFINDIQQKDYYENEYVNTQARYLDVDIQRGKLLRNGINLLDRSFVSVSAHVYAIYKLGLVDIRSSYLELLVSKVGEILIPDIFVFVSCEYETSRARCFESGNRKQTGDLYLSEQYFRFVKIFNVNFISMVNGHVIDTESIFTDTSCVDMYNRIVLNSRNKKITKDTVAMIDNIRNCLDL
ncbi:MAG: deoxynucleoside kinase [Candidatus Moranbacteria bacterium]|nr:deoxynucleoside kinase [Candidatus Moranbacteria bacterium]MDD3964843.1 deoxynucleoside kinase [Candidatus Moranbacteria bacterium]